jgi:hypothetical protein
VKSTGQKCPGKVSLEQEGPASTENISLLQNYYADIAVENVKVIYILILNL